MTNNNLSQMINQSLNEHLTVFRDLASIVDKIQYCSELVLQTLKNGKRIFICGNGGSAADSQHFAAELTGHFAKDRNPLPAIALTTDTSALTAIANDYSYEDIFSRQLMALASPGDLLIGISTSGNSKNVLKAFSVASLFRRFKIPIV